MEETAVILKSSFPLSGVKRTLNKLAVRLELSWQVLRDLDSINLVPDAHDRRERREVRRARGAKVRMMAVFVDLGMPSRRKGEVVARPGRPGDVGRVEDAVSAQPSQSRVAVDIVVARTDGSRGGGWSQCPTGSQMDCGWDVLVSERTTIVGGENSCSHKRDEKEEKGGQREDVDSEGVAVVVDVVMEKREDEDERREADRGGGRAT
jgi:hypothetical protein